MPASPDHSLTFLVIDPTGQQSTLGAAARAAGHRVVVVTGVDTALVVLPTLGPDAVLVRCGDEAADRAAAARIRAAAPNVPIRFAVSPVDDLSVPSTSPLN